MKKLSAAEFFLRKKLTKEAKRAQGCAPVKDLAWLEALPKNEEWWRRWEAISALIDRDLAQKKLYRSPHKKMLPFENGIPSLAKRGAYREEFEEFVADEEEEGAEGAKEPYEREKTDDVYKTGAIMEEFFDDELVEEEFGERLEERPHEEELRVEEEREVEILEDEAETNFDLSLKALLPGRARPKTDVLLRRYPLHLKESLSRALLESGRLLTHDPKGLLPAVCFFAIGVKDKATFKHIAKDALPGGPYYRNRPYTWEEYQRDHLRLFHLLKREKRRYFLENRFLLRQASRIAKNPKKQLETLWERFEAGLESLTKKQWNAIKQVRVKKRRQTKVAKGMQISLDSLRDRLEGAERKLRRHCPELAHLFPSKTYIESKEGNYIYDGLLDKRAQSRALPLFRIDPLTKQKTEIAPYAGDPRPRRDLDPIVGKAWAHDTTPVPDFSFTDYFTQLFPKALFDRLAAPGTLHDRSQDRPASFQTKTRNRNHYHPNREKKEEERENASLEDVKAQNSDRERSSGR